MTMTLEMRQEDKPKINIREYRLFHGKQTLLRANKDLDERRAILYWAGKLNIPVSAYIQRISQFYREMCTRHYSEISEDLRSILGEEGKPFEYGLHLKWKTREGDVIEKCLPLEILLDHRDVTRHPHFHELNRIKVSAPYAEFGLDCRDGASAEWVPSLWLTGQHPLGMPLASFFSQTAFHEVRAEDVKAYLDVLFDF